MDHRYAVVAGAIAASTVACHRSVRAGGENASALAVREQEVLTAEHEWVRVTLAGDADAFASFLADTYVELNPRGQFVDKATWTERIRSGRAHYESVDLHDLHVRFPTRDVAVVTGAYSQKAVSEGRDNSSSGVYVNTWVWMDGRWQAVSSGFAPPPAR